VNVDDGDASADYGLPADLSPGTYGIRAVYNPTGDFFGSNDASQDLIVNPDPTSHFLVTPSTTTPVVGVPFAVTVTAQDPYSNTVSGYAGIVTLSSTDPQAEILGSHRFAAADHGIFTFTGVDLKTAGLQTLTVSDGTLSGTVRVVAPAPPAITSASHTVFTVGKAGSLTIVTAPGWPAATTLTATGAMPGGVSFTDDKNGTATLSGTPAAGKGGVYLLTLAASNGLAPEATQVFTLTVDQPPAITSAAKAAFAAGQAGSFTVTTSGFPASALTVSGALPLGVSFTDNKNGTATLKGTPAAGKGVAYVLKITASNGVGKKATQTFTLTVIQPPKFTSAAATTFTAGKPGSFTISTSATSPASTTLSVTGALPQGVSFTDNKNGTATLKGTPPAGKGGFYLLTFTAGNGPLKTTQTFTLTVNQPPAITSAASDAFVAGQPNSFVVATSGFPTATLTVKGTLPQGVSFTDNKNGTATLTGTPPAGKEGVYVLTITAVNGGASKATQTFTLTVKQPPSDGIAALVAGQMGPLRSSGVPAARGRRSLLSSTWLDEPAE
jgi:hypothetical protein